MSKSGSRLKGGRKGGPKGGQYRAKKRLGQNFLADRGVIEDIVAGSGTGEDDLVIEIGPGMGALTEPAAKAARRLVAIELDSDLVPGLKARFALDSSVEIIEGDILETDLCALIEEQRAKDPGIDKVRVMGNLPYYITTPIIMKLLEDEVPAASITIMMQKEVAERIMAEPGGKDYGALSIACQYHCRVSEVCDAPAEAFRPQPKVDSKVLRLDLREEKAVSPQDEKLFFDVVKAGFSQRRKTLSNCLASLCADAGNAKQAAAGMLEKAGIDPARRAETLTMEEFARLADTFAETR